MFTTLSRNAKLISLVVGFLFATIGTLWSFTVTDNLAVEIQRLSDGKAALADQVEMLNRIGSEYFIANQQGDLIFITAQQTDANQEVARLIYQGNMLDRATPVRNMLGALATAGVLDYRETYDAYEKLNDQTRANFSFDNFVRLKTAESEIILQGQERVPVLVNEMFELQKAINAKTAEQSRNRMIGLIAALLGSAMLLGANLLSERGKASGA